MSGTDIMQRRAQEMTQTRETLWIYPNGMGADGRPLFEPQSAEDLAKLAAGQTREGAHTHTAGLQELHWPPIQRRGSLRRQGGHPAREAR